MGVKMTEPRHNCLAGDHYPKQIPDRWTDEKGKPSQLSNRFAGYAMVACTMGIIVIMFLWAFGSVGMNPFAVGDLINMDETIEQKRNLILGIRDMSCDEQAVKLAGNEYSTQGMVSDSYYANQEYKYLCLGVERPVAPDVNYDPRNERK